MRILKGLMLVAPVLTIAACSDSSGPAAGSPLTVSFATLQASGSAAGDRSPSHSAAPHTLDITSAAVVLDHVELAPASIVCPAGDDNDANDDHGTDGNRTVGAADQGRDHHDACEDLAAGPVLVQLPVGQSVVTTFNVTVPAGTYTRLEARLAAAQTNTAAGGAFLTAHPDLAGVSVRVEGAFDGTPFTYTGRPHSHLEFEFEPPVVVGSTGVNVTVHVSLDRWFRDQNGGLVNPATANDGGPNADLVARNIRHSFRAFRDDHRRGDDGQGDGDGSGNDHDGGDN